MEHLEQMEQAATDEELTKKVLPAGARRTCFCKFFVVQTAKLMLLTLRTHFIPLNIAFIVTNISND